MSKDRAPAKRNERREDFVVHYGVTEYTACAFLYDESLVEEGNIFYIFRLIKKNSIQKSIVYIQCPTLST